MGVRAARIAQQKGLPQKEKLRQALLSYPGSIPLSLPMQRYATRYQRRLQR